MVLVHLWEAILCLLMVLHLVNEQQEMTEKKARRAVEWWRKWDDDYDEQGEKEDIQPLSH